MRAKFFICATVALVILVHALYRAGTVSQAVGSAVDSTGFMQVLHEAERTAS